MFLKSQNNKIFLRSLVIFLILTTLFAVFSNIAQVRANELDYYKTKVTAEEQAVFAFFRAANAAPDFEYWIMSSPEYKSLESHKQEDHLIKEMLRLGRGYGLYDSDTDVLELKAPIVAKYHPAKEEGKRPHLRFRFLNLDSTNIPTFDYPYGPNTVSLTIKNLNYFSDLPLSEEQNKAVLAKIPYEKDEFDAELIIHTQVYKADHKYPVEEGDGWKKWLMVGKIAYVKCEVDSFYAQQEHTLWDYVAPWYEEQFRIKNLPEEEKYPHPYDLYK